MNDRNDPQLPSAVKRLRFADALGERLGFPAPAREVLCRAGAAMSADRAASAARAALLRGLQDETCGDCRTLLADLSAHAERLDFSAYTLHLQALLEGALVLYGRYAAAGVDDSVFYNTVEDLRRKLDECLTMYGVPGTFVGTWFAPFYRLKRFGLGRLQFENARFDADVFQRGGVTLRRGDPVYAVHIPSGGPLTPDGWMDAFARAHAFFGFRQGQPMALTCDSWLLNPAHEKMLPVRSNILGFARVFTLLRAQEDPNHENAWRIFGPSVSQPVARWPRETSLQRAYADWITAGGPSGAGYGVALFDGARLLA